LNELLPKPPVVKDESKSNKHDVVPFDNHKGSIGQEVVTITKHVTRRQSVVKGLGIVRAMQNVQESEDESEIDSDDKIIREGRPSKEVAIVPNRIEEGVAEVEDVLSDSEMDEEFLNAILQRIEDEDSYEDSSGEFEDVSLTMSKPSVYVEELETHDDIESPGKGVRKSFHLSSEE